MLRGTVTGTKPFALFFQLPPASGWNHLRLEDEFDAMLYLGPASSMTMSRLPASLCRDNDYVKRDSHEWHSMSLRREKAGSTRSSEDAPV